jgi:SSS family solute:Na+ symporter
MQRVLFFALLAGIAGLVAARGLAADPAAETADGTVTPEMRDQALAVLRETLQREPRWVKVHAAEFLIGLARRQGVADAFEVERGMHESQPEYRIGIWRVLARSAEKADQRKAWIDRIKAVLADPAAPDHVHAVESLAKLGVPATDPEFRSSVERAAAEDPRAAVFANWLLAGSGDAAALAALGETLDSTDPQARFLAAYGLQWLEPDDAAIWRTLRAAVEREDDAQARIYLLSAALVLAPDESAAEPIHASLVEAAQNGSPADRTVACSALAARGGKADVPTLYAWLGDADPDARAAAAAALLRVARRQTRLLGWLDWSVIVLYFAGMLGIGWFFRSRTQTADDYLLGGRTMKPWAVGLSLFATLLSTISYLSSPGEIILHGPMYFASLLSFPFISVVVGWLLIPYFVKLPLTSAYEILEARLGLGVRLLGAVLFLSLRLLWMAVIIDATTSIVLVPLVGFDPSITPYVCAFLGLITVAYTSMGGMRAVVWTDVAQTFVLLGGALVALGLITWQLGGVGQWWPTTWASNWDPPTFDYDPFARISMVGVILSTFSWYVFTSGSDQMAIQRYLSTRDAPAARRMFNVSLIASATVLGLLALLGLALLAYFRAHPEMLGEGQSVEHNADQLFPRFIAVGLPAGMSGLVVAGLLAAAMSSLSSGLNSSCAVITVDFLDRFLGAPSEPRKNVRRTRYVSWCVGVVVVLLSSFVGIVEGNLLEVAYKVTNLLVAPLFGLFFMALFVRWATSFGTFVGAAFGLVTVVAINYWDLFTDVPGISFLWAMPLGLVIQVAVGAVVSLAPIGMRNTGGD